MGVCWQNTAYNQPPHLGYFLPGAMLPRLTNETTELTVNALDSIEYTFKGRYLKSSPSVTNYVTDDGKRTFGLPDSLKRASNAIEKTTTLKGYFINPGTYRFAYTLTGLGNEKVIDTLYVHVLPADPSGIEELPVVAENENCQPIVYDAAGRRVNVALGSDLRPLTSKKGLYIIKEGKRSRKVIIR
jgi:rhamnogalacturonan endolyase